MISEVAEERARIEALGERIAEQGAHLDAATHTMLVDIREFDEKGGYAVQGARSCAQWLSWRLGWTGGTAREHVRVARKLANLPRIDDALRRGEISYCKARAMTRVATPINEAMLLEEARYTTGGQLERICQKYGAVVRSGTNDTPRDDECRRYLRKSDTADGMVRIEAVLHPEEAAIVWAAIEREAIDRCRASRSSERSREAPVAESTVEPGAIAHASHPNATHAPEAPGSRSSQRSPTHHRPNESVESTASIYEGVTVGADRADGDPASIVSSAGAVNASIPAAENSDAIGCVPAKTTREAFEHVCQSVRAKTCVPAETNAGVSPMTCVPAEMHASKVVTPRPCRADDPIESSTIGTIGTSAPSTLGAACTRDRKTPSRPAAFDRASALVSIAESLLRGTSVNRSPIEVVLTVPAETLRTPKSEHDPSDVACFLDGTCVSSEAARRLACDCGVVEVIEDEGGIPLSVGRRKRTIPGSMKKAMLRRDRTCRFPGCNVRVFLHGHHVQHWLDGGETNLSNMVCLCDHHHRFVHEYGYTMQLLPTGEVLFRNPHGLLVPNAPPPARPEQRGLEAIRVQNADLDISADTPACGWTGDPVDYGLCVEQILRIDDGYFSPCIL